MLPKQEKENLIQAIENDNSYNIVQMGAKALPFLKKTLQEQFNHPQETAIQHAIMEIEGRCMDY